jgi:hypothetical protein
MKLGVILFIGFVNAQSTGYWDTKNPHTIYEVPLHDQNMGVWFAVNGWRIIELIFFLCMINSEGLAIA